jgi:hypothetical protein
MSYGANAMAHTQRRRLEERKRASDRKIRLTLSLERSTVDFLYHRQAETKAPSLSACMESLVDAYQRYSAARELERQTLAYYDSISDEERTENNAWGQFGESEFRVTQR